MRSVRIAAILLPVIAATWAGVPETVSVDGTGASGGAHSNYVPVPPWMDDLLTVFPPVGHMSWSLATVDDAGRTVFVTAADGFFPTDEDGDYDVYRAAPGQPPTLVDYAGNGPAREAAAANGLVVFTRDTDPVADPPRQTLYFRDLSLPSFTLPTPVTPAGVLRIRHVRLASTPNAARAFFSGEGSDGRLRVYRIGFRRESGQLWAPEGAAEIVVEDPDLPCFHAVGTVADNTVVYQRGDAVEIRDDDGTVSVLAPAGMQPVLSETGATVAFTNRSGSLRTVVVGNPASTTSPFEYAPGQTDSPRLSRDGRYLVFRSNATLIAGFIPPTASDDAPATQVYVYDTVFPGLRCLSADTAGLPADGHALNPDISPDGRFVTFASEAPSLTGSAAGIYQLFRVDRAQDALNNHAPVAQPLDVVCMQDAATLDIHPPVADRDGDPVEVALLSEPTMGALTDAEGNPPVGWLTPARLPLRYTPPDGFTGSVSFLSQARDVHPAAPNAVAHSLPARIRIHVGRTVTCLTADTPENRPTPADANDRIGVSGDGRLIAFGLEDPTTKGRYTAVLRDTATGTVRVLLDDLGTPAPPRCHISASGNAAVFVTVAPDPAVWYVPLHNGIPGTPRSIPVAGCIRVSVDASGNTVVFDRDGSVEVWYPGLPLGAGNPTPVAQGSRPCVSPNGGIIAFVPPEDGGTAILARGTDGRFRPVPQAGVAAGAGSVTDLTLSNSGRFLAFALDEAETRVYDLLGIPTSVSAIPGASTPWLAAGGDYLYLVRNAVPAGGTVPVPQAYRRCISTGTEDLLSPGPDGGPDAEPSYRGFISGDGRFACFASEADPAADSRSARDVFRVDLPGEVNRLPGAAATEFTLNEDLFSEDPEADGKPTEFVIEGTDPNAFDADFLAELVAGPSAGSVAVRYLPGRVILVYTPPDDFSGTDTFTARIADGAGNYAFVRLAAHVLPRDDAPELAAIPGAHVEWGESFPDVDLTIRLTERDGDTVLWSVTGAIDLTVTVDAHGNAAVLPPDPLWVGEETLTFTATDDTQAGLHGAATATFSRWCRASVRLEPGWNLISIPMVVTEPCEQALRQSAAGRIWYWQGGRYEALAPREAGAEPQPGVHDVFTPGTGYWIFRPGIDPVDIPLVGDHPGNSLLSLDPGWSLAGPLGSGDVADLPLTAQGIPIVDPSDIFLWQGGTYGSLQVPVLTETQGYWLRLPQGTAATLDLALRKALPGER